VDNTVKKEAEVESSSFYLAKKSSTAACFRQTNFLFWTGELIRLEKKQVNQKIILISFFTNDGKRCANSMFGL
jgi:hypothetical protein